MGISIHPTNSLTSTYLFQTDYRYYYFLCERCKMFIKKSGKCTFIKHVGVFSVSLRLFIQYLVSINGTHQSLRNHQQCTAHHKTDNITLQQNMCLNLSLFVYSQQKMKENVENYFLFSFIYFKMRPLHPPPPAHFFYH